MRASTLNSRTHSNSLLQAALIEYNLDAVDAALNAVREAVASGMDWHDLGRMIKVRRLAGCSLEGTGCCSWLLP